MLAHGANLRALTPDGKSIMHAAVSGCSVAFCKSLMSLGADAIPTDFYLPHSLPEVRREELLPKLTPPDDLEVDTSQPLKTRRRQRRKKGNSVARGTTRWREPRWCSRRRAEATEASRESIASTKGDGSRDQGKVVQQQERRPRIPSSAVVPSLPPLLPAIPLPSLDESQVRALRGR